MALRSILAAGALALFALPASAQDARDADRCARVAAVLDSVRVALAIPGAQAAVHVDGRLACHAESGVADLATGRAVDERTLFRIGSVSKVLTADAAAFLAAEGALDLDAPVRRYVPAYPAKRWEPTVRHLATHTAGVRHYRLAETVVPNPKAYASLAEALERFADDSLLFEPGTRYAYTTYGYVLLGAAIEGAAGVPYERVVQERVLAPLGLSRTHPETADTLPDRSVEYEMHPQGPRVALYDDVSYKRPGGGWLSTASDLAAFGGAHAGDGAIPDAVRAILFAPASLANGEPVHYDAETRVGLAWRIGRDPEGRAIVHHGGATRGGRAVLVVWPDPGVAVAITANALVKLGHAPAHAMGDLWLDDAAP